MLMSLLGSKSVEKVLLYLLVNQTCYAHQLHKRLQVPLTPIQNALMRLEKGGVITSFFEKKRKIYTLNSEFPLLYELEALLKKGFHHLVIEEKREYYDVKPIKGHNRKESCALVDSIWEQLKRVSSVSWVAKSLFFKDSRKGSGQVVVFEDNKSLIFIERGSSKGVEGEEICYTNKFRWGYHEEMISLEHLRFGEDHPVFLFNLIPVKSNLLESSHSHICKEDVYFGALQQSSLCIQLHFRAIGPHKNEETEYLYIV